MKYNRERERKFVLNNVSYTEAYHLLLCHSRVLLNASSSDSYWKAPGVDFVRLRENTREITVKKTDKGTTTDRIEENVEVYQESMPKAGNLLTLLFGNSCLKLSKNYSIFEMIDSPAPGITYQAVLSLYTVSGDKGKRIFFEIEASTLEVVDHMLAKFDGVLSLSIEKRSLFQIFREEGLY
jgi:hypothetical protein